MHNRKITKKITALILSAVLSLSTFGCSGKGEPAVGFSGTAPAVPQTEAQTTEFPFLPSTEDPDPTTDAPTTEQTTTEETTTEETTTEEEKDLSTPEAQAAQEAFEAFADTQFKDTVSSSIINLHYKVIHPENYGIKIPEYSFGDMDISDEAVAESYEETRTTLAELREIDRSLLLPDQQFDYDVIEDYLKTVLLGEGMDYLYEPFAYTSGIQSNLPVTMSEYKLYQEEDVKAYLALLRQIPELFDTYLTFEEQKIDRGLFMSAPCADEVIRQCTEFIESPEENLLIETFNDNIEKVEGLSEDQKESYRQQNREAVLSSVIPSFQSVIDFFTAHREDGVNELGLCYLENGKEYYKYLLRSEVGTDKTPEEVIALLDETMEQCIEDLYTVIYSDYEAYESYFEESDSFYEGIDPKDCILDLMDYMKGRFPAVPEGLEFTAVNVHPSLEGIVSPAFYMTPAIDDYLNNSIYINPGNSGASWSTYAHEGYPGHMLQFSYYLSKKPRPIRTILDFGGYQEGWATYAENFSYEYFDYEKDAYGTLEKVNSLLNTLLSARIEIGVNYEGWDRDEVVSYVTGLGFGDDFVDDLMRYVIAEPVNYQMYLVGYLEFLELRDYAETQLGSSLPSQPAHIKATVVKSPPLPGRYTRNRSS